MPQKGNISLNTLFASLTIKYHLKPAYFQEKVSTYSVVRETASLGLVVGEDKSSLLHMAVSR